MKGIAHFASGLAVATFFPEVVYSASQNLSLAPLMGGLAGLLPDTLDFKLTRYFSRLDEEIDPAIITDDAGRPDPQGIAERIAGAMNRAFDSGEQVNVQIHTLKLAVDLWQQYSVAFDLAKGQVVVRIGPAVTTMEGISSRQAAISIPGVILSQLVSSTRPSSMCACTIDSMMSAISSREGRE